MKNQEDRSTVHGTRRSSGPWLAAAALATLLASPAPAQDVVTGEAVASHAASRAVIEAGKLLRQGKLAEVRRTSAKDVRDEWAAMSASEQGEEAATAQRRAPDPATLAADLAPRGELTIYGDSAKLWVPAADGNTAVMAFVSLEDGRWKVTAGPLVIDTAPVVESAPPLVGAAILEHEIGKLALAYAGSIAAGRVEEAMELTSAAAREKRGAASSEERAASDRFRRSVLPEPAELARQIRDGGKVTFVGEEAYLNLITSSQTDNADGSTSYTSSSFVLPFVTENGRWRLAN